MALLITLFLVLINIFNNITTNSPKAEGLTAIEIWMLACILFVFGTHLLYKKQNRLILEFEMLFILQITGALIEYALILFKKQKVNKYGMPSQSALAHRASAASLRKYSNPQQILKHVKKP